MIHLCDTLILLSLNIVTLYFITTSVIYCNLKDSLALHEVNVNALLLTPYLKANNIKCT